MGLTFFCAPLMVDGKIKGIFYGGGFCSEDNKKPLRVGLFMIFPLLKLKKFKNWQILWEFLLIYSTIK